MPECSIEERAFLDKLKESFLHYRDEDPWDYYIDDYIDDMLYTIDFRPEAVDVLNFWDQEES